MLSKLGYIFVQASEEGDDCDILNGSAHNSDEGENKVNVAVHEVTQQNVDDYDMPNTAASNPDDEQNKASSVVPGVA